MATLVEVPGGWRCRRRLIYVKALMGRFRMIRVGDKLSSDTKGFMTLKCLFGPVAPAAALYYPRSLLHRRRS
jgi:hypothetical protein